MTPATADAATVAGEARLLGPVPTRLLLHIDGGAAFEIIQQDRDGVPNDGDAVQLFQPVACCVPRMMLSGRCHRTERVLR
jgi:hypothetical protein